MESEKVKEIKKVLESFAEANKQMTLWQEPVPKGEKHCIEIKYADILTLINELERENESCYEVLADLKTIIKQQNDRIAELEKLLVKRQNVIDSLKKGIDKRDKENVTRQKLIDDFRAENERLYDDIHKKELPLKHFAEKVKALFVEDDQIREDIDETLKEFVNE